MTAYKETISKNIKRLRQSKGLTLTDAAKALNTSPSTISDWETGRRTPRAGNIEKLAEFFGCWKSDIMYDAAESVKHSVVAHEIIDLERLISGTTTRIVWEDRFLSDREKALVKRIITAVLEEGNEE